jgi:hypothetical protein
MASASKKAATSTTTTRLDMASLIPPKMSTITVSSWAGSIKSSTDWMFTVSTPRPDSMLSIDACRDSACST